MTNPTECVVTFPVRSGIFGVDRLAKGLRALQAAKKIGEWHVGQWVDWRHTAIAIRFDSPADASCAQLACRDAGSPSDLQP